MNDKLQFIFKISKRDISENIWIVSEHIWSHVHSNGIYICTAFDFFDKLNILLCSNVSKRTKVITWSRRIFTEQIEINFTHQFWKMTQTLAQELRAVIFIKWLPSKLRKIIYMWTFVKKLDHSRITVCATRKNHVK